MSFLAIIKNVSHSSTDPQKSDQAAADRIRSLISSDAKIDEISGGHTALTLAAEKGCLKSVKALLESKKININHCNDLGLPVIAIPHIADEIGYEIVLTLLDDKRFDPNQYAGKTHIAKYLFDSSSRAKTTDHLHGCLEQKKDIQNRATDLVIDLLKHPKMKWDDKVANDLAGIDDVAIADRLIASFTRKKPEDIHTSLNEILAGRNCLALFLRSNHDKRGVLARLRQSGFEKLQALRKKCEPASPLRNYPGLYGSFDSAGTELAALRDKRVSIGAVKVEPSKVVAPSKFSIN